MRTPPNDLLLASLRDELRVLLAELNNLHHPVYPGDPERIAALGVQVAEVRQAIRQRRAELRGSPAGA